MNQKTSLTLLIFITAFWALVIVPCFWLSIFTVFLADGHPPAHAFALIFFGTLSFPLAIVVMTPLAWIAYFFKKHALALVLSLLPLFTLIFPILGFVLL